jgi:hypothetical protein
MNKRAILRTAHALRFNNVEFNMAYFGSCIASWVLKANGHNLAPSRSHEEEFLAQQLLGLENSVARQLFFPDPDIIHHITPARASKVLKRLVETGKVDWNE